MIHYLYFSDVKYHNVIKKEDGSSQRILTYILTLNYTIGPKHSETTVTQVLHISSMFCLSFSSFVTE